jgi:hypothetical protein
MLHECSFQWVASCIRRGCCSLLYLIPSCGVAAQASQSEVPGLRHNLPLCVLVWRASPFAREEGSDVMPIRELYCCSQECCPIKLLHVITNVGLFQTYGLTNLVPGNFFCWAVPTISSDQPDIRTSRVHFCIHTHTHTHTHCVTHYVTASLE